MDEVDAFPILTTLYFYYAVKNSVKEDGLRDILTATSTDELDRKVLHRRIKN